MEDSDYDRWVKVRVKVIQGEVIVTEMYPPLPKFPDELRSQLDQKLALLKLTPINTKIPGVGWHRAVGIFYIYLEKDYERNSETSSNPCN